MGRVNRISLVAFRQVEMENGAGETFMVFFSPYAEVGFKHACHLFPFILVWENG
jgi:hypothetical protein